jgi:hypothetical protein
MLDVHDTGDGWRVMRIAGSMEAAPDAFIRLGIQTATIFRYTGQKELWRKTYPSFEDLPEGTRYAVACLRTCAALGKIKGIGQRVSENTFWLRDSPELIEEYGDVV